MSEIANAPTSQYLPPLDYPKPLTKLIATHDAAHEAWRHAYAEVVAADAALTRAPAEDEAALVASVASGKGHPGQTHQENARVALAIAEEKCRVAREAATTQTDIIKGALEAATAELVPIVLDNVHAQAARYDLALADCQARMTQARDDLRTAMSAMRMVSPHILTRYGVSVGWHENNVAAVSWPVRPTALVHDRIQHLESLITDAEKVSA